MCPLPTAITSRVPAREGGLTLPEPRGMHSQGNMGNDQARDVGGPGPPFQDIRPKCKADLRHLDKAWRSPWGALETVLFHGV